jgi:hypothetical protein
MYLLGLVSEGRYKGSSEEMKTLIACILDKKGREFTNEVKEWFDRNNGWHTFSKVPIGPGRSLSSKEDLGDIDILAFDSANKRILSIECKNIRYGRTPYEIADEIENIVGENGNSDSWTQRHIKRDVWLRNNVTALLSLYHMPLATYEVSSIFLTAEEIPSTFVRKMPLPSISFTRLRREGIQALNDLCGL